MKNLPNLLTVLRIVMIPFFIACFYIQADFNLHIAALVFFIAYSTDVMDGYIARKKELVSDFGKLMDPIADKLLTASAVIMLTNINMLSPLVTFIIIAREIIIGGLRLVWVADGRVVAADKLGKLKTMMQFIAIMLILLENPVFGAWGIRFDMILMYMSVALSVISCVNYIYKNSDKGAVE